MVSAAAAPLLKTCVQKKLQKIRNGEPRAAAGRKGGHGLERENFS